jgi:molecular chaperone Hsp33
MSDALYKFLLDGEVPERSPVRGEIVSLDSTWRQMRQLHDYPEPVMRTLGELVAASALLTANLKFSGALIMQIHGDGPVPLLVVECNADMTMRATASIAPDAKISADVTFAELMNTGGKGRFAITLDPKDRSQGQQPYQGIVPLEGDSVAAVLGNYMLRSEQLDTQLWLAADSHRATGMLLQRLPLPGGAEHQSPSAVALEIESALETWQRGLAFANTLEKDELLKTDPETLMRRLFWEETLRIFEPMRCSFLCGCSRERVAAMLITLGRGEVEETLAEEGTVHVKCDFCNRSYDFDSVDCAQLFATSNTADGVRPAPGTPH